MSVWLCIPSARPPEEADKCLRLWRERGYGIALWTDGGVLFPGWTEPVPIEPYPGYAVVCNWLINTAMGEDPKAEWFVCAGDDTDPDPTKSAEEIARECSEHFEIGPQSTPVEVRPFIRAATFGVMQPTGDRWQEGKGGFTNAPIDRVAGSPWIGRSFAERMYGGSGPYWPKYTHMFVDEELQAVAEKYGVFWQRRDLTHRHNHVLRDPTDDNKLVDAGKLAENAPHLVKWNNGEHWKAMEKIFLERKNATPSFPGSEPL